MVEKLDRTKVSKFNSERIEKWRELTRIKYKADDNTKCPICKDQIISCNCVSNLAQDILESLFYRKVKLI